MHKRNLIDRIIDPSETTLAWLLLTPAIVFILLIVTYPVASLIYNSFFDIRLSRGVPIRFIGLENYVAAWRDATQYHNAAK